MTDTIVDPRRDRNLVPPNPYRHKISELETWVHLYGGHYELSGGPLPHSARGVVIQGGRKNYASEWLPDEAIQVIDRSGTVHGELSARGAGRMYLQLGEYCVRTLPGFVGGCHFLLKQTSDRA